jgi:uncharacterized membrane protein
LVTGLIGSWMLDALSSGSLVGVQAAFTAVVAVAGLVLSVCGQVFKLGFKHIGLRLARTLGTDWEDMLVSVHTAVRYIVGTILFNLLVVGIPVGIVWLAGVGTGINFWQVAGTTAGSLTVAVVAGLAGYLALIFHLYPFVLLDRDYGVVRAFHVAWSLTEGAIFELVIFYAVVLALNLVGALLLGIGLLVTIPITILAQAHAYKQLTENTFDHDG